MYRADVALPHPSTKDASSRQASGGPIPEPEVTPEQPVPGVYEQPVFESQDGLGPAVCLSLRRRRWPMVALIAAAGVAISTIVVVGEVPRAEQKVVWPANPAVAAAPHVYIIRSEVETRVDENGTVYGWCPDGDVGGRIVAVDWNDNGRLGDPGEGSAVSPGCFTYSPAQVVNRSQLDEQR